MPTSACRLAAACPALLLHVWSTVTSAEAVEEDRLCADLELQNARERDSDQNGWYLPDFFKLQTGGYAGTLAVGVGYSALDDVLNLALLYGYVPPVDGRSVQSLHLTASLRPFELGRGHLRLIPIYAGVGGLHTWAEGYFIELPPQYPAGYYPATGIYLTMHAGAEFGWLPSAGTLERHSLYFELTTVNVLLWRYFENPGLVNVDDVVSIGFGYRGAF